MKNLLATLFFFTGLCGYAQNLNLPVYGLTTNSVNAENSYQNRFFQEHADFVCNMKNVLDSAEEFRREMLSELRLLVMGHEAYLQFTDPSEPDSVINHAKDQIDDYAKSIGCHYRCVQVFDNLAVFGKKKLNKTLQDFFKESESYVLTKKNNPSVLADWKKYQRLHVMLTAWVLNDDSLDHYPDLDIKRVQAIVKGLP